MSGGTDRSDPRRRRPASCGGSLLFAPRRRRYLAAPGDVLHAPLLNLDLDEHQCVNHFALGWTLLTPSAWISIPHEARRPAMADRTRLERVPCSVPQVHTWTCTHILSSTVRARVTLSGFDTQGTTAPNEAPCRSRQEATWSNFASRCFGAVSRAVLSLLVIETRERENRKLKLARLAHSAFGEINIAQKQLRVQFAIF